MRVTIINRISPFILRGIWLLALLGLFFLFLNVHRTSENRENLLLQELIKGNSLAAETQKMRPIWSNLLSDIEGRQRLAIENQDAIMSKLREIEKTLQNLKH